MIASAHIAAGVVAGVAGAYAARNGVLRSVIALGIGVASHVALDAIPHADYGYLRTRIVLPIVLAEALVVSAIAAAILRRRLPTGWLWPMIAGLAGATIPDVRFGTSIVLPSPMARDVHQATNAFHRWFHAGPADPVVGVVTQVAAAVVLVLVLFAFPRRDPPT